MHPRFTISLALGLSALSLAAFAQAPLPRVEGEVRRIDVEQQKLTLRHGEIPNIEMSPMTMTFRVPSAAMLTPLKPGDKVVFTADKVDGVLTVQSIQPVR
jgi:Cu/Ag efflux protein CusF